LPLEGVGRGDLEVLSVPVLLLLGGGVVVDVPGFVAVKTRVVVDVVRAKVVVLWVVEVVVDGDVGGSVAAELVV
jgi:3-dehydroquinate synthetase